MLKRIVCLFLYSFLLLASDSDEDEIFNQIANLRAQMHAETKAAAAAQEQWHNVRNRLRKEKLEEYQQDRRLPELAKAKSATNTERLIPLIEISPKKSTTEMKLRIQLNQQRADDNIIKMALDILGLDTYLDPSWQDIQAAYARLSRDPNAIQSPALLDKAFLALREFKDSRFSKKHSGFLK